MKTVFLADGEKHVLVGLRLLFEQQTEYTILGEARSAESLLTQVCQLSPNLILLDWELPGLHPQRLLPTLRECCQSAKIVALSVKPEHERISREFGVDGFISKQFPSEVLLEKLETLLSGLNTQGEWS